MICEGLEAIKSVVFIFVNKEEYIDQGGAQILEMAAYSIKLDYKYDMMRSIIQINQKVMKYKMTLQVPWRTFKVKNNIPLFLYRDLHCGLFFTQLFYKYCTHG